MEPAIAPEPVPAPLPEPAEFVPDLPAEPASSSIGVIPADVAARVRIEPAPVWTIERTWEQPAHGFSGSNAILLMDTQHHAERHERFVRVVRKLDTINAVHEAGQWRLDFDPLIDRLTIHSLAVLRNGQRVENALPGRLRLLQREQGLNQLVIDGMLTVMVLLEDVRVGDVLDLSFSVLTQPRLFPSHFWSWAAIPRQLPLLAFFLSVRFDSQRPLRWKSNDPDFKPTIREGGPETEWSWQTGILESVEMEPNVPTAQSLGKWVQVTDFASWAKVAAGFVEAWPEELQSSEIVLRAQTIAAQAATPAQRAECALTFLQDEIRYLSVNSGLGGQIPAPPGLVVNRGFGDCKDKTFAAAHLLRLLGIPARPVLVHTGLCQAVRECLPMPDAFDHAVIEYVLDGRRCWVDVTVPLQGGTALSRPMARFGLGLPVGPGVQDLEPMTAEASSDRLEIRETFVFDPSGRTSSLQVMVMATGRMAEQWRRGLALEGVEVFARRREQFYQDLYPAARRLEKLEWEDDRESNHLVIGEVFELPNIVLASEDGRSRLFRVQGHVVQSVLSFHEAGKRRHPWALHFPYRVKHTIELDSPGLEQISAQISRVDTAAFRFSEHSQARQGFGTVTLTLQTLTGLVPATEFEVFKAKVREVWPKTVITGFLSTTSSVSWRKRSPKSVLVPRRAPVPSTPAEPAPGPNPDASLPAVAAPCESPEFIESLAPSKVDQRNAIIPRQEKGTRTNTNEEAPVRARQEIRRPNPSLPPTEEMAANSSRRRHSRRRARETRRRHMLWLSVGAGALALAGLFFFLFHAR